MPDIISSRPEESEKDGGYGSFEVFHADKADVGIWNKEINEEVDSPYEAGWYWWACFPGCLPDGDAMGHFATSKEAYDDANE